MTNVTITNQGLDWEHPDNCYWKNEIAEKEKVYILSCVYFVVKVAILIHTLQSSLLVLLYHSDH